MIIHLNDKVNTGLWDRLLRKSRFSSPFQTRQFFDLFNAVPGLAANVFACYKGGEYNTLVVVTRQKEEGVKSFFSRRGIIYGGIVLPDKVDNRSVESLLNYITGFYRKRLIYLEIRNYFDYGNYKDLFVRNKFNYIPWLNFHLDTTDELQLKKNMGSSRRRQIRHALKNGAVWREAENVRDIEEFYEILRDLYSRKVKKPLFPKSFFTALYKQQAGKYLLVYYEGKVIGGILSLIYPGKAMYEFYVCGLDYQYKNQHPSVMATWAAMEYATQNNITYLDFMGAGSPEKPYGVREFKSRFGGKQVEYGKFLCVLNPLLYKIGEAGLKILFLK